MKKATRYASLLHNVCTLERIGMIYICAGKHRAHAAISVKIDYKKRGGLVSLRS